MANKRELTIQEASATIDRALGSQQKALEAVLEALVSARKGLRKLTEGAGEASGTPGASGGRKTPAGRKRKGMSATARKAIGDAMRKRWAERKAAAKPKGKSKAKSALPRTPNGKLQDTLGQREAV